jgi:alkylation response protein AidB-like acyl-CoA dehydrogenase
MSTASAEDIRPQEGPSLSASEILANAKALATEVRDQDLASEYDRERKLPVDIVAKVRSAGVMRMNMPRIWGGPQMTPMEQVEVIEALCRADASIGWCSFIWTDSGIYSGYLDDAVGREMYPRLDMATSGWVYPMGRAERLDGGYRMSGQWMFGSGCNHCDWLVAGCTVFENGEPVMKDGRPEWRILMAKPEQYEILDTWYTTGLRGTGSCDYRCENVFVPEERSFSLTDQPRREGSIWKRPDHFLRKMSGVPLGVAGDALDVAQGMLRDKGDRITGQLYRDMTRVQTAVAEAHMKLSSARSYVFSSLERQWEKLERDEPLTVEDRADVWLSRTHAFQTGRDVVRILYDTVGGSAIYAKKSPFDRHLRDMQTACQHLVGQMKTLENAGSLLLGGEPGNFTL